MEKIWQIAWIFLIAVNAFAFLIMVFDKLRAIRGGRRVRESVLLTVAVLGGSPAMLVAMLMVRHKIRKKKFFIGVPVILLLQVAAVVAVWRLCYA